MGGVPNFRSRGGLIVSLGSFIRQWEDAGLYGVLERGGDGVRGGVGSVTGG